MRPSICGTATVSSDSYTSGGLSITSKVRVMAVIISGIQSAMLVSCCMGP